MNFLDVTGISKKSGDNVVLKNISFSQKRLQKIAIAGATGSGKSTLLKIIAGLLQTDYGEVLFEQEKVLGPDEKLMPGHKHIAYLSQYFELRNNYKVEEVLSMANTLAEPEAERIYEVCRIRHLLKRKTDQLSGGEKQRIATARLLISSPKLLLLDEPYSNLDMAHKSILKSVINDISEKLKITCIMISHDPADILSWADEIVVMRDGEVLRKGTPRQIYQNPVDEYIAGLLGKYNVLSTEAVTAFLPSQGINQDKRNVIVRPEFFKIVADEKYACLVEVLKVVFYGAYYEIEVMISKNIITLRTENDSIAPGDKIYISMVSDNIRLNTIS